MVSRKAGGPYSQAPQLLLFRRRLRAAVKASGYGSLAALEEATGLARSTISQYLNGTRLPNAIGLVLLERALGVSAEWLLGFDVPAVSEAFRCRPREQGGRDVHV